MKIFIVAPQLQNDKATELTLQWALQLETSLNDIHDVSVISLFGRMAVREKVESALNEELGNQGIFVFIDHGERDALYGSDAKSLIDGKNIELLKNKFIYAIACRSAAELGRHALQKGVQGYIGFNHDFHIITSASHIFSHCFLSGLTAMVKDGKTMIEAIETIKTATRDIINRIKRDNKIHPITRNLVVSALQHNLDYIVPLGSPIWRISSSESVVLTL
jgi:hypothetical protein